MTIKKLKKLVKKKGYAWFDGNKPYNVNIIGYRTKDKRLNIYNDFLYLAYRNENLNWVLKEYTATTDPGLYYLQSPPNNRGTAILAPGQYRSTYKLDLHRGRYKALCQRLGPVKVYRDYNRDKTLDMNPVSLEEGWYGINIHRASKWVKNRFVNKYSAGCTVMNNPIEYDEFINIIEKSAKLYGNKFTYTLLEEE
jgi:hypothetical protein